MRTAERISSLTAKLALISQTVDEALVDVAAIDGAEDRGEVATWLPGLDDALKRIQLECVDARYAVRELRTIIPDVDAIQPRLL